MIYWMEASRHRRFRGKHLPNTAEFAGSRLYWIPIPADMGSAVYFRIPAQAGFVDRKKFMTEQKTNRYRQLRDSLGWSREHAASELGMSDDKLERIENGRQAPNPQDVLAMSRAYHSPQLCNYYCNQQCEIGRRYVPEVPDADLPDIIVRLLNSIYEAEDTKKVLVRITADSQIDKDEIPDLVRIQNTFEELSIMIEALQLCIERKIADSEIPADEYEAAKNKLEKLLP